MFPRPDALASHGNLQDRQILQPTPDLQNENSGDGPPRQGLRVLGRRSFGNLMLWFTQCDPDPVASASPRNLLEYEIVSPTLYSLSQKSLGVKTSGVITGCLCGSRLVAFQVI